MKRSDIHPMPEYFEKYINLVNDVPLLTAFENSLTDVMHCDINAMKKVGNRTYAAGKWTVNETMQHLVDVEKMLCYRTLLIARNDQSQTPNFDEELIARNSKANERPLEDITEQLAIERQATIALFKSFDEEVLLRTGYNWKYKMNILAFGFCIIGHQMWHLKIIHEKYLTLH